MPFETDHPAAGQSISDDHAQLSDLVGRIRSAIETGQGSLAKDLLLRLTQIGRASCRERV